MGHIVEFKELFAVTKQDTLNFFYMSLADVVPADTLQDERVYVSSILAHYALTSRLEGNSVSTCANLAEVFDTFVLGAYAPSDPQVLEGAGSQILLFAGFFRDQMAARHNVRWYDELGTMLFGGVSKYSVGTRRKFFAVFARHFSVWTRVCSQLNRGLAQQRYLLGR